MLRLQRKKGKTETEKLNESPHTGSQETSLMSWMVHWPMRKWHTSLWGNGALAIEILLRMKGMSWDEGIHMECHLEWGGGKMFLIMWLQHEIYLQDGKALRRAKPSGQKRKEGTEIELEHVWWIEVAENKTTRYYKSAFGSPLKFSSLLSLYANE